MSQTRRAKEKLLHKPQGGDVSQGYGDIVQYSSCPRIRLSRNQYAITAANREKRRSHAARKQPLIIH